MVKIYVNSSINGGICYYIKETGEKAVLFMEQFVGPNVAEYNVIIKVLETHKDQDLTILSSNQTVVRQLLGEYRVKDPNMLEMYRKVKELIKDRKIDFKHVRKKENLADKVLRSRGRFDYRKLYR